MLLAASLFFWLGMSFFVFVATSSWAVDVTMALVLLAISVGWMGLATAWLVATIQEKNA